MTIQNYTAICSGLVYLFIQGSSFKWLQALNFLSDSLTALPLFTKQIS